MPKFLELKTKKEADLLFQTLDNKRECYAIYCDGSLYYYPNSLELSHTWDYTKHASSENVEYAKIWAQGLDLDVVCPEELKADWQAVNHRAKAFLRSFVESKVNLNDVCFYDLVPRKFLLEYCDLKNKICEYVFDHHKKPKNYEFMSSLCKWVDEVSEQELNISYENLDFIDPKMSLAFSKLKSVSNNIKYNPWGSVTGRLTTKPDSFPILTLNKSFRSLIAPNNDLFVELDYNAAEVRTLLSLTGKPQPQEDIHAWISENIFNGKYTREQSKIKFFAWLYNPTSSNKKLDAFVDRHSILQKSYIDDCVHTRFDRIIEAPPEKALNYLIQSSLSDMFLRSMLKVHEVLKGKKSKIAFSIHDSLVLDMHKDDKHMINDIVDIFSKNDLGKFKVNLSMGKNFGQMRSVS